MNPVPRQMPLMLEHRPALGKTDFLVSASNAEAVRLLSGWRDWPRRHLALVGPARAGKTHLAHVWMRESGAELLPAARLDDAAAERLARIAVSDVILYNEEKFAQAVAGGDVVNAMAVDVDEARAHFNQRIPEAVRAKRDFLIEELERRAEAARAS